MDHDGSCKSPIPLSHGRPTPGLYLTYFTLLADLRKNHAIDGAAESEEGHAASNAAGPSDPPVMWIPHEL